MPYYHERISPRLKGFDYSQPHYYYVTICTFQKRCLFGRPENYSHLGQIAQSELKKVSSHYADVSVDKYIVMPNHVHVIFAIGCHTNASSNPSLSTVVGQYKSAVSKQIHEIYPSLSVWQKSFNDEIIRNQAHYKAVWNYIDGNPAKWETDDYFLL